MIHKSIIFDRTYATQISGNCEFAISDDYYPLERSLISVGVRGGSCLVSRFLIHVFSFQSTNREAEFLLFPAATVRRNISNVSACVLYKTNRSKWLEKESLSTDRTQSPVTAQSQELDTSHSAAVSRPSSRLSPGHDQELACQ